MDRHTLLLVTGGGLSYLGALSSSSSIFTISKNTIFSLADWRYRRIIGSGKGGGGSRFGSTRAIAGAVDSDDDAQASTPAGVVLPGDRCNQVMACLSRLRP